MQIKDLTPKIRFKYFITILIISTTLFVLYKFFSNDFVFPKFEFWNFCLLIFMAVVSAYGLNRVKLKISEIESIEGLINWLNDYFDKYKAKKIFESEQQFIYQIDKGERFLLFLKRSHYYNVSFNKNNIIITGPFVKKPKIIN